MYLKRMRKEKTIPSKVRNYACRDKTSSGEGKKENDDQNS